MTNAPPHPWWSLQSAIRRAGLNHTSLAQRAGISRPYVTALANGKRRPTDAIIGLLATTLGVPIAELRADVSSATSPEEMLHEIDGLCAVLDQRIETVTTVVQEMKAKREQLQQLTTGAA